MWHFHRHARTNAAFCSLMLVAWHLYTGKCCKRCRMFRKLIPVPISLYLFVYPLEESKDSVNHVVYWSRWPRNLRRWSETTWFVGPRVQIPLRAWIFVPCLCCVVCGFATSWSLVQRSHIRCVFVCLIVCDLETSKIKRPRPEMGCCATEQNKRNELP
jgi:hypothetical protein